MPRPGALTDGGLARKAYEAYGDAVGWRNYIGIPMPPWSQLTDTVRGGWVAAVVAVTDDLGIPRA